MKNIDRKPITSRVLPSHTNRTYFNSGRAALAFLLESLIKPTHICIPNLICDSLLDMIFLRFPQVNISYYEVKPDLSFNFPQFVDKSPILLTNYFGYHCRPNIPSNIPIIEDVSHSFFNKTQYIGTWVFASLRKLFDIGDGGFVQGYYNPRYESSAKPDTWLRYQANGWHDLKEADNLLDQDPRISDMSSQALATIFTTDLRKLSLRRRHNESYLRDKLKVGTPLRAYTKDECPLTHIRAFATKTERDQVQEHLASQDIYTTIYWATHPQIVEAFGAASWFATNTLAFPIGQQYNLRDMKRIVEALK